MGSDSEKDAGRRDQETATARSESSYPSDVEKDGSNAVKYGAVGIRDLDAEAVAHMDAGHLTDLNITASMKADSEKRVDEHDIERMNARSSAKSILSQILTSRNKKARIEPAKLPISDLDNGIVGWESQDDPAMPFNVPESRKWFLIFPFPSITFISPLASSMFAPAVSFMDADLHSSSVIVSSLSVSIFVCGFVIGPLFLAPLSEIYGRRLVLTCGNVFFCVWQIGCALAPNVASLIVFRLLAGIGGAGCLTIGAGVISDIFHADQRGLATAIYTMGSLFGPAIGPIGGGFIGERIGWSTSTCRLLSPTMSCIDQVGRLFKQVSINQMPR